ncbi:MAG: hypothetical protein ACRYFS_23370 [Janthinobacterium lividum]
MRTAYSVIVALILLTGVSVQAQQVVVPGRSIGTITLGMPGPEVWKHLGRPTVYFLHLAGRSYVCDCFEVSNKREIVTSHYGQVVQIERDVTDDERRKYFFPFLRGQYPYLKATLYDVPEEDGCTIKADNVSQGIAWAIFIIHYQDGAFSAKVLNDIGPGRVIVHWPGTKVLPNAGEIKDEHDSSFGDIRAWFAAKPPKPHKGN